MDRKRHIYDSLDEIPEQTWMRFSKKIIFFGHQSVGTNILDGCEVLKKDYPLQSMPIVENRYLKDIKKGALAHFPIGRNMAPRTKIDAFKEFMDQGLGNRADAAFFKFCYVDINNETDIKELFDAYSQSMASLKTRYSDTKFIHVTVPLTTVQKGPKAWIKKIIGHPIGGYLDNIMRNRFNQMMREEYVGKESIFDLAFIESIYENNTHYRFNHESEEYMALIPQYASDGKHLNNSGNLHVARHLMLFLVNTI